MIRIVKQNDPEGEQVPYGARKELYQCEEAVFIMKTKSKRKNVRRGVRNIIVAT
jgi:hypothetical protein